MVGSCKGLTQLVFTTKARGLFEFKEGTFRYKLVHRVSGVCSSVDPKYAPCLLYLPVTPSAHCVRCRSRVEVGTESQISIRLWVPSIFRKG